MTRLIIARHGNTFEDNETPRRIGVATDTPLTEHGYAQSRAIGKYLKENGMVPDAIFTSMLRRTRSTGWVVMIECGIFLHVQKEVIFNEIDYGPDENRTESEVVARVGEKALKDWDENGTPPPGWDVRPQEIISNWQAFADRIVKDYAGCTILVVTSNGIARYAPYLTGDFTAFKTSHDIKLKTGALGVLVHENGKWASKGWNIRPETTP